MYNRHTVELKPHWIQKQEETPKVKSTLLPSTCNLITSFPDIICQVSFLKDYSLNVGTNSWLFNVVFTVTFVPYK